MPPKTALVAHGEIETKPTETYGTGPVLLRIGNGGAGATGLLRALSTTYLSTLPTPHSITWTRNHSRNTQLALHAAHIDLALTYEPGPAALAAAEGWSHTFGPVFHDHFVLAGPATDPAGIRSAPTPSAALARIADARALFHSRADGSATTARERALWAEAGRAPWEGAADADWYAQSERGPAEALRAAGAAGAYVLTDRSTLLRQVWTGGVGGGVGVFCEPEGAEDGLMNSCYALYAPGAGEEVRAFVEWVRGEGGQGVVRRYGVEEVGEALFAAVEEGWARRGLKGGRAVGGRWVVDGA
ncbi:hypothetical protein GTA08_BOTSDO02851 [Neofusicoccum parvum]|nr:hypothetical protein GTA08_BOTSDO02851 [Neofusicoccum parvum]